MRRLCYTDLVSIAVFQPVAVTVLAVCAVVAMVFAALAERRGSAGAIALRWLGAICAVLAGAFYAIPSALLVH